MDNRDTATSENNRKDAPTIAVKYNDNNEKKSISPGSNVHSNNNNQSRNRRSDISEDEADAVAVDVADNDENTKSIMTQKNHFHGTDNNNLDGARGGVGVGVGVGIDNRNVGGNDAEKATGKVFASSSIRSIGSIVCRICHNAENPERLISPCMCKGTLMFVHIHCLEHWLSTSGMVRCELCHFQFRTEHSLRYTCLQSLRIWYNHPSNRGSLQADFLICSLLSIVTFGLVGISLMGIQYYVGQGNALGISPVWTQGSLVFFLTIIVFVYSINLFMVIKSQLVPWYRWWQSAKEIKLILENRSPVRFGKKLNDTATDEIQIGTTKYFQSIPDNVAGPGPLEIASAPITVQNPENPDTQENRLNSVIVE